MLLNVTQKAIDESWQINRNNITGCLLATAASHQFPGEDIICGNIRITIGNTRYNISGRGIKLVEKWCCRHSNLQKKPKPCRVRLTLCK